MFPEAYSTSAPVPASFQPFIFPVLSFVSRSAICLSLSFLPNDFKGYFETAGFEIGAAIRCIAFLQQVASHLGHCNSS